MVACISDYWYCKMYYRIASVYPLFILEVYILYASVCVCSNLLLSIRLQISSSDVPLLVVDVSIAICMSSIHFSLSISELE